MFQESATRWFLSIPTWAWQRLVNIYYYFYFLFFPLALIFVSWLQQGRLIYHHSSSVPWPFPYLPLRRAPAPPKEPVCFPWLLSHVSDLGLQPDPWLLTSGFQLPGNPGLDPPASRKPRCGLATLAWALPSPQSAVALSVLASSPDLTRGPARQAVSLLSVKNWEYHHRARLKQFGQLGKEKTFSPFRAWIPL